MGKAMSSCPSSRLPQGPPGLVPTRKEGFPSPGCRTAGGQAADGDFDLPAVSERARAGRIPEAYTRKG